jgi:dTMP kinase
VKPRLITREGGEGVGKSTNLAFIESHLKAQGVALITTREPGGTPLGESIRGLLLDGDPMTAEAELLLVFAARAEHLATVIRPALESGQWVLCDRFTDASYAYQGGGRGVPLERIAWLETWIQAGLNPDLTLLLDAPIAVGMGRARARGPGDRFEQETDPFFERVRAAYLARAQAAPHRVCRIDAAKPLALVQAAIAAALDGLLRATDGVSP